MTIDRAALRKLWDVLERGTRESQPSAINDRLTTLAIIAAHVPALLDENDDLATRLARAEFELASLRAHMAELERCLRATSTSMKLIDEPCDHDVGICGCAWRSDIAAAEHLLAALAALNAKEMGRSLAMNEPRRRCRQQGEPMNTKPIILCCGTNGRALVYGYVQSDPVPGQPVRLERARMVLYYPSGGTFGLAAAGPPKQARVTNAVAEVVETVWQEWLSVTPQAAGVFDGLE